MEIKNGENFFELRVMGYEFPNSTDPDDSSWLEIAIKATAEGKSWSAKGAYLRDFEFVELIEWLYKSKDERSINFTENELSFERNVASNEIIVVLDFDFHPNGNNYRHGEDEEIRIHFPESIFENGPVRDQLNRTVKNLRCTPKNDSPLPRD